VYLRSSLALLLFFAGRKILKFKRARKTAAAVRQKISGVRQKNPKVKRDKSGGQPAKRFRTEKNQRAVRNTHSSPRMMPDRPSLSNEDTFV
jgi:hypothetical protein